MVSGNVVLLAQLILAGLIIWATYSDIKGTNEDGKRWKKIMVYAGVFAFAFLMYISLRTFAKEPLDRIFFLMGGQVRY